MILRGADITYGIAEHLIGSNFNIVDERLPQIMAVLYSDATPEDALKPKAEKPTAPTEPGFNFD